MEKKFTKGNWTYSKQRGTKGDCFIAQVWDSKGSALAEIETTEDEKEASHTALLMSKAPLLLETVEYLLKSLQELDWPPNLTEHLGNLCMNAEQLLIDATTLK